ncbi:MAG: phosphomannomutase/phosphoglucomutase, partial [Bacteroidales bacterium]|nr:phosphomannomutase/phosphoglucomutase [Bacteroidales bacterium]MBQ6821373.1 phosphomannomutase/phosphoglucomutase [Bacteroidales bacterium]MBR0292367.1 phosphomannomutase/phosphoglucomutase [Bacteroidales bacterium]
MGAFHAYDIRGIYNVDFDKETAYKVGYFLPGLLGAKEILVGRDCRTSSQEIHDYLLKGITDAGADVCDVGLSSTPMVYFGTANYGFKASVQITASHNPAEYNGMKVSRENALPVGLDTGLGQIKQWIEEGKPTPPAAVKGKVREKDIHQDYIDFLMKYKGDYSNLKIAMDCSNGMSSLYVKDIYGSQPSYIFDTLDGRFPNHEPNPLIPKNVEPLKELVRKTGADVGVIYDGDADRVMFVDEKARFVAPDLVIALMAYYFCDERGEKAPRVLQEIRSSKAVGEFLADYGAEMHTWRVGRAFAAPKLREIDGLWGGELAGHYYFKDFFYSDSGMLASIIVLRIVSALKKQGRTLSGEIDKLTRYRNSGEINFRVEDKKGAMDAVRDFFCAQARPDVFMDFDGYRAEYPDWWFNIRPSNTEPYLRFICEATTDEVLNEKIAQVQEIIEKRFGGTRA